MTEPRRPRPRRRQASEPFIGPQEKYPPDPKWGTDAHGRFRYEDYDGESLVFRHDRDGNLWVESFGEGPVFIKAEHIALIMDAMRAL